MDTKITKLMGKLLRRYRDLKFKDIDSVVLEPDFNNRYSSNAFKILVSFSAPDIVKKGKCNKDGFYHVAFIVASNELHIPKCINHPINLTGILHGIMFLDLDLSQCKDIRYKGCL